MRASKLLVAVLVIVLFGSNSWWYWQARQSNEWSLEETRVMGEMMRDLEGLANHYAKGTPKEELTLYLDSLLSEAPSEQGGLLQYDSAGLYFTFDQDDRLAKIIASPRLTLR